MKGSQPSCSAPSPLLLSLGNLEAKGRDGAPSNASGAKMSRLIISAVFTTGVGILFMEKGCRVTQGPGRSQSWMQWAQAGAAVETGDAMTGTAGCIKPQRSTKAQV